MSTAERFPLTAEIITAFTSSLVLDEVLASVARRTAEVLDLWECDIYDYVAGEDRTTCLALWTREPHAADGAWVGSTQGLDEQPSFARVLHQRHVIENHIDDPDLLADDRTRMDSRNEKSCLLVPLIFRDEVTGCLELVEKRHLRRFTADERQLASALAALAAAAIQNARLYGDVEHLAVTDGLTGLRNYSYFCARLAQEVARAQRYDLPLSLLVIDIDDFKAYNERFGHSAGDALLRQLVGVLQSQVRQDIDLIARYRSGGADFAVILPSTGAQGGRAAADSGPDAARTLGERIRISIESETFGADPGFPVVTVGIGVASMPGHATTADDLADEADRVLSRAKQLGKNRVEVA